MSTCSVYGAQDGLLDEQSALNPLSSYARSKIAAETVLGNRALIFRLGTLYGISDTYSRIRFDLVVNTLVMRAHLYNAITVFGGGQYRPLLHVRDAASAIAACLGRKETGVFNLHSENATILELGECLRGFFPSLRVDVSDVAFQDTRNYRVTSARAEKTLGFRPRLKVVDGVKELKQLLDEGRVKDVSIRRFSNFLHLKSLLVNYDSPIGRIVHPASEQ